MKNWWDGSVFSGVLSAGHHVIDLAWANYGLSLMALSSNGTIHTQTRVGVLIVDKTIEQLQQAIVEIGGSFVRNSFGDLLQWMWVWPDGFLSLIYIQKTRTIYWDIASLQLEMVKDADLVFTKFNEPNKTDGVYVLINNHLQQLIIQRLGAPGVKIQRDNYTREVLTDFDHVCSDMSNSNPCGRIVLFDGVPGGGKTYLVRGLIHAVQNCTFVIVPTRLLESLTEPNALPTLLNVCNGATRVVLIFEDADAFLVPRMGDNISAISAILNLSDGILGSLLDLRIIATTNAKIDNIDPALCRPMRLCRRVAVDKVPAIQVKAIYHRLSGRELPSNGRSDKEWTLAEVYQAARGDT